MSSTNYFIKVRATDNVEPNYWSRQVLSPTQANLYYTGGNVAMGGIIIPYNTLSIGTGGVGIGTAYYQSYAPEGGLICSGNVGIGISVPSAKLEVVGKVKATTFEGGFDVINVVGDLSTNSKLGVGTTNPQARLHILNTTTDDCIRIEDEATPDSTRFLIDQYGNVGIGTTVVPTGDKVYIVGSVKSTTMFKAPNQYGKVATYLNSGSTSIGENGSSYASTIITAGSITPVSSSSKFQITLSAGKVQVNTAGQGSRIALYKSVAGGAFSLVAQLADFPTTTAWNMPIHLTYVDSPSTASSVEYKIYISGGGSGGATSYLYLITPSTGMPLSFTVAEICG